MPIGSYSVAADITAHMQHRQPVSLLDLGIGYGLNGATFRNYRPKARLVGVEGWKDYVNPMWDCYDRVMVMTIQKYLKHFPDKFGMVIMTDVIEHFEKEEGIWVLNKLKEHIGPKGIVLVSTPAIPIEQGAVGGNELETHRSFWTPEDFNKEDYRIMRDGEPCKFKHRMLIASYEH